LKSKTRHSLVVFILIALFGIALSLITARFEEANHSREALITAIDQQIALVKEPQKEALLIGAAIGANDGALEKSISAANDHYAQKIAPFVSPVEFSSEAIDKLESAKKIWNALQGRAKDIVAAKATIAKESETFLRLAPQLKVATQELSQMMETRRVAPQMAQDAKKQVDLSERLTFLAAAYLADGSNARYEELSRAINAYSQTLYGFSNAENMQAPVLALVGTNQLFWKSYQESLTKAIENRKQTIKNTMEIYQETNALVAALNAAKTEIANSNQSFLSLMRGSQIALALLIAAAIGYALCLFMPFRKEPQMARAPQNLRKKEFLDEESRAFLDNAVK
jgi:hypothetical protein